MMSTDFNARRSRAQTQTGARPRASGGRRRAPGFTLVEILVVLAIIAILAALLFPAFRSAQNNGKEAACKSNMQQIYLAVRAYYDDEKKYPSNLSVLLPTTEKLDNTDGTANAKVNNEDCTTTGTAPNEVKLCPNPRGSGHLKSTKMLVCPSDDTAGVAVPRASYGDVSTKLPDPMPTLTDANAGRYAWNYWGYNKDGNAYPVQTDTTAGYFGDSADTKTISGDRRYWRDGVTTADAANHTHIDPSKLPRLANRNANSIPTDTIISHCVYHRLPTSNLADPTKVYDPAEVASATGASDIILRLDGSADKQDIVGWQGEKWIKGR